MKKRALVAMLVSAAMACTLFVGCSTPTKETSSDSGSKTESSDSKETLIKNQRSTLNCYYLHFFRFNGINGPSIPSLHA